MHHHRFIKTSIHLEHEKVSNHGKNVQRQQKPSTIHSSMGINCAHHWLTNLKNAYPFG
jgi:hypothetical protein